MLVLFFCCLGFVCSFVVCVYYVIATFAEISDGLNVGGLKSTEMPDFDLKHLRLSFHRKSPMLMKITDLVKRYFQLIGLQRLIDQIIDISGGVP